MSDPGVKISELPPVVGAVPTDALLVVVTGGATKRAAASQLTAGDFVGAGSSTSGNLVAFTGTDGKHGSDSGIATDDVLLRTGDVPLTGDLSAGTHKITDLQDGDPGSQQAATVAQVETLLASVGSSGGGGGGDACSFTFDVATADADPGAGKIRINNLIIPSVTQIYVSTTDYPGSDITNWLDRMDDTSGTIKGYVRIATKADPTRWIVFRLTGVVAATGYRKLQVEHVAQGYPGAGSRPTVTVNGTTLMFDAMGAIDPDVLTRTSLRARAIATSNVSSLSGLAQTFDGIALNTDGQVVLLVGQTDKKENGPWVVHSGAWTRPTWFATGIDVSSAIVIVQKGTGAPYADTGWLCTTDTTAIVGTDDLDFKGIFGANLDGTSLVLNGNTIVRAALTGDATAAQGSNALTLAPGVVTDTKVATGAAIAGTKISPDFGSQDIVTTGALKLNNSGGFIRLGLVNGSGSGVASAASTGGIRLPRGNTSQAAIYGRNNADTGDYLALQWDSVTPRLILGDTTAGGTAIYLQSSLGQLRQGTNAVFDWTSTKLQPRLSLSWVATAATPLISQDDAAGTSATGEKMTIRAQSGTGGSSIGGDLDVGPGAGTTRGGLFRLMAGGTTPGGGAVRLSFNDTGWAWDGVTPIAQPARVGQLTDSTTGSGSSTIGDVGGSFSQTTLNNIHASLINRINGLEAIIHNRGISA